MRSDLSFAEILEEMTKEVTAEQRPDASAHVRASAAFEPEAETRYDLDDSMYRLKDSLPRGPFTKTSYIRHSLSSKKNQAQTLKTEVQKTQSTIQRPEPEIPRSSLSPAGQTALSRLGIFDSTINMRTVKRAYRSTVRRLHPDLNPGANHAQELAVVTQAYELIHTELRARLQEVKLSADHPAKAA